MSPHTTRVFLAAPLLLLTIAAAPGCASRRGTSDFMKSVNSIRPGTPMDTVRDELGAPDDTRQGIMPDVPPPGPLTAVAGRIPPGARYRQWVYKNGDSRFHVFFAQTLVQSGDRWEVVSVRSVPASSPD